MFDVSQNTLEETDSLSSREGKYDLVDASDTFDRDDIGSGTAANRGAEIDKYGVLASENCN